MSIITKILDILQRRFTRLNIFGRIFRKIPTLVWGLLACTTIFVGGMLIGYLRGMQADSLGTPVYTLKEENRHLKDVTTAYDELTRLYFQQGQDVSIVFNQDILEKHPGEITDALQSINQHRDVINLQLGRIIELRRTAGLVDYSGNSYNIR